MRESHPLGEQCLAMMNIFYKEASPIPKVFPFFSFFFLMIKGAKIYATKLTIKHMSFFFGQESFLLPMNYIYMNKKA